MTLSITQLIAKLDATVSTAKTAAPLTAIANNFGCILIIDPMNRPLRRARSTAPICSSST